MNTWRYILLITINMLLIIGLVVLPHEKWIEKTLQVLIVIVTFTIFRMYLRERNFIGSKKEVDKK